LLRTFVYNMELRFGENNRKYYSRSKLLLADFIELWTERIELRKILDTNNEIIFIDPISAEPKIIPYDMRYYASINEFGEIDRYLNEVLMPFSRIMPYEIKSYRK
jgi:hypothetical protein